MHASSLGLGAVLAQKQDGQVHMHPVAYASHTLNPQEKNYGITEMETLAACSLGSKTLSSISTRTLLYSIH